MARDCEPVTKLAFSAVGILVYPVQPTLHTTGHSLFLSTDGKSWQAVDSTDLLQAPETCRRLANLCSRDIPQPGLETQH